MSNSEIPVWYRAQIERWIIEIYSLIKPFNEGLETDLL